MSAGPPARSFGLSRRVSLGTAHTRQCGVVVEFAKERRRDLPSKAPHLPQTCHRLATDLPRTCHRLATDLPQTCHGLATDLPRTCHRSATRIAIKGISLATDLPRTCRAPPCLGVLFGVTLRSGRRRGRHDQHGPPASWAGSASSPRASTPPPRKRRLTPVKAKAPRLEENTGWVQRQRAARSIYFDTRVG